MKKFTKLPSGHSFSNFRNFTVDFLIISFDKVSILVNNAGVVSGKVLLDCSDEQIQRTFDVNVLAHFWVLLRCSHKNVFVNY